MKKIYVAVMAASCLGSSLHAMQEGAAAAASAPLTELL